MKTNDELASRQNRPPKVQAPSSAQARKVGWRTTSAQLRSTRAGRVASGSRRGTVSGRRSATCSSVTAPNTASSSSVARQPKASTIRPPTSGESTAIRPRPVSARDIMRAPAAGSNRSRTIERPQVTAAAMAAPCAQCSALQCAQAISVSMLPAAALAEAGERVERQAGEQHRPAAEAVGERAADELAEAEADDQRRQRLLGGADAGAELALQRRQGRQVEVGGDRLDAEQQGQHDDDGGGRHRPRRGGRRGHPGSVAG